jgi:large subunit ribosomal protein L24
MHIQKGDTVKVLSGKDRGKTGVVKLILRKSGRAIVEGVNFVNKHEKKTNESKKGGIIRVESPLYASKLMKIEAAKSAKKELKTETTTTEKIEVKKEVKSSKKKTIKK